MSYTVLLVDDDPSLLPTMEILLTELTDFTVLTAINGREGLERVMLDRPDCVVIDVRMPELNGYQFVRVLRGDPDTADIPLIILSALVQDKDKWIGLAAGVDRYLTKPVEAMELISAIEIAVRRGEEERLQQLAALESEETFGVTDQ